MSSSRMPDFRHLTLDERLQLVGDVWDSIAESATRDTLPISEEHRAIGDERFDEDEGEWGAGRPYPEVLAEITRRLR